MGLVKKLLGGTLAFLGGIFGFLGGLLGLGQKSEYFREFEEATESASASLPAAQPAKAIAAAPPAPAKPTPAPKESAGQPVAAAAPAKADAPAAAPAKAKAEPPAPKPKVQVAKIENGKVEQLSESAPAAVPAALVEPSAEQTFAPKYLLGMSSNGRRRPGPSLNYFRDMAKQVKTN